MARQDSESTKPPNIKPLNPYVDRQHNEVGKSQTTLT